jgi:hypothetical protein
MLRVSEQAVARWEKAETEVAGRADVLLRVLFPALVSKKANSLKLVDPLRSSDERPGNQQLFEHTRAGWQPIADGSL